MAVHVRTFCTATPVPTLLLALFSSLMVFEVHSTPEVFALPSLEPNDCDTSHAVKVILGGGVVARSISISGRGVLSDWLVALATTSNEPEVADDEAVNEDDDDGDGGCTDSLLFDSIRMIEKVAHAAWPDWILMCSLNFVKRFICGNSDVAPHNIESI